MRLRAINPSVIGHEPSHRLTVAGNNDFLPLLYAIQQSTQLVFCFECSNLDQGTPLLLS
jgi:hypothetical protein